MAFIEIDRTREAYLLQKIEFRAGFMEEVILNVGQTKIHCCKKVNTRPSRFSSVDRAFP